MSDAKAKEPGLGNPLKTDVKKGGMDVQDLAAVIRRMGEQESKPAPEPEPEPTTSAEATDETPADATAVAAAETGKDTALSQSTEPKAEEASEPAPDDPAALEYPQFQKRVNKLTAQKKEAQAKIAELEAQLVEAKARAEQPAPEPTPAAPPTAENPFLHITNWADLKREEANAESVIEWCDANADGVVVREGDSDREYSGKEVRDIRRAAERAVRKHLPAQQEYLRQREHFDQRAADEYRWWADKSTAEYQQAANVLRVFPEIARFPDYKLTLGDFVTGYKARAAKAAQPKTRTAETARKAPPHLAAPAAQPAAPDPSRARSDAARTRFSKTGNVDDLAKLIASSM